ncbi:MAG: TetR/AcrR family transcriptional regulator [Pseudomonadota bacterium]
MSRNSLKVEKQNPEKRKRGRPPAAKEDGKELIKAAALEEFAGSGFKGASVERIAITAGVAKPLVHYHFGSKQELWIAAVSDGFEQFQGEAESFVPEFLEKNPDEVIDRFAEAIVRFSAQNPYLVRISTDETSKGGERADWLKERYLLPLQNLAIDVVESISGARKESTGIHLASILTPAIFGAINFPYIDAHVVQTAHGVDVFSEQYIDAHTRFIAMLMKASFAFEKQRALQ